MIHIRQKLNLAAREQITYTVVVTEGWEQPLEEHPSIVEHPELFEIVDADVPDNAEYLIYQS